jgi:hypothetical protein
MSFALARQTRAELMRRGVILFRRSLCAWLCFALTFSLTAFLVGGPVAETQHEAGRHDHVSDAGSPTTWVGRWNPRVDKGAVGFDYAWVPQEELDLLVEEMTWIEEPEAPQYLLAHTSEKWRAAPVRGPPV